MLVWTGLQCDLTGTTHCLFQILTSCAMSTVEQQRADCAILRASHAQLSRAGSVPALAYISLCQRKLHAATPITVLPDHHFRLALRIAPRASWTSLLMCSFQGWQVIVAGCSRAGGLISPLLQPLQQRAVTSLGCSCACMLVPGQIIMCSLQDHPF